LPNLASTKERLSSLNQNLHRRRHNFSCWWWCKRCQHDPQGQRRSRNKRKWGKSSRKSKRLLN